MCRSAVSKSRTCGICVKLRGLLKTHFRLVHGNKGSRLTVVVEDNSVKKTYVCKICDKKFAKNSLRNEHLLFSHGWDALDDGNKPLLDIDPTPFPYQATGDVVKKSEQNPDDRGGYFSTDNESNDANNESDVSVKRERKRRRRDREKAGYPLKPLERITSIKVEPSDRNTNDPPHGKHKRRCSNSKRKKETYAYCENLGQKEDGKTYFKCSNCSYESHLKPNVKRHYDVVHLNVHRYRCTQCDVAYKGREALVRHLAREQCGGTFEASPKRRPRRGRRRNTIDTDPEELDACVEDESYEAAEKDSDATPKKDVNVAYYEDLGEGSKLRYKCIECDYMSSVKRSVKLHHEALHQNSGQFTCLLCSRSFSNKTAFESHLASKKDCNPIDSSTPEKAQYDCKFDGCNYTTRLKCNMKRHYKRQHSAEYNDMDVSTFCESVSEGDTVKYKCKSVGCDYISKYRPNVKRHFDRYHCTSDFECNFCRRKFPKKALLHSHILKHASKATDVQREVHNTQATANVASEPANAQADLDPSHAVPHYANKPVEMQQRSFETPTTTYANLTDKPIDIQRQFETPQALPSFGNKPASVQGAFEAPNIITAYPGKPLVIEQSQNYPHFPRHPMDLQRQFDPLQTMPGFPVKPIVTQQEFEASQTVPGFAKWENTVQPKAIGVTGVQDEYPVAGQPRAVQQPFETPQNGTNRIDRGSEDKSTNVVAETGSDKTQTCQLCSKSFATLDILAQHLNEHISEHSHLCEICAKSFLTKVQLTQHLRRHSYNLQCRFCPKMFNCKTSLKIHENTHTGEKPNSCEFCGKGFACRTNLLVHLRVHTGEKPYKCKLCEYTANQSQSVKKHMIASHGGERTFACHLCSRMFKFKSALTMHIRRHLGDKRHFCDICNMGFVAPNTLKEHKRTHSDVRAFKCTMCTQAFKRKDKLTHHIKSQHSKPEANPPSSLVNVSASISQMLNWHNYPPM